jgi:signal transduction histidine kinase
MPLKIYDVLSKLLVPMKRTCLLVYYIAVSSCIWAQTGVNELLHQLSGSKSDSEKINVYNAIIGYYDKVNPDSASYYAELGLQFATEKKRQIDKARMLAHIGLIDKNQGRTDIAQQRLKEALQIYRQHNFRQGIADITSNLGAIEAGKGNFDVAIRYFIEALKLHDSLKNNEGLLSTYIDLGKSYMEQSDSGNTMKYFMLAADLSKKMPLSNEIISLYNSLGLFYIIANRDTAKGLNTFLTNLELSKPPKFARSYVECLMYLGNFYIDRGERAKAIKYLDEALKIAREKKMAEEECNVLLLTAVVIKDKDPVTALSYFNQATELSETIHNKIFQLVIFDEIARLHKEQGNYKDALAITEKRQVLKDSIFNINKAKEIAGINATYQFEEANERISELEAENREHEFEKKVVGVVAAVIILIFGVLLFFYRKVRLLNTQLRLHEKELEEANAMKNKLFSIIGHDLRSPIVQIPMMLDIYEDDQTDIEEKKFLLDNLKEHTKATTETLDKLLYWGQSLIKGNMLSQIKLEPKDFISQSIEFKKMAAAAKQIRVTDNTPAGICVLADPTHFDFVIRNLLANAIKYTHPAGAIEINADTVSKPGFAIFSISDTGVGIDKKLLPGIFNPLTSTYGTANEKGTGIGLMLCKEFVLQNGGEIWVESEAGKGSTFYFSVKMPFKTTSGSQATHTVENTPEFVEINR